MALGSMSSRDGTLVRGGEAGPAPARPRSRTPPGTPRSSKPGKLLGVRVLMLDDSVTLFQVQVRSLKTCFYALMRCAKPLNRVKL